VASKVKRRVKSNQPSRRQTLLGAVSPGQGPSVKQRRGLSSLQNRHRSRSEEVLSNVPGSDPFRHSIPTVKGPSAFGMACSFAGERSERRSWRAVRTCNSTRMGLHPISHASLATGGVRKSNRGGTSKRKLRQGPFFSREKSGSPSLRSFGLRVSHVLLAHLKGVAGGGEGSTGLRGPDLESGCRGIRVARCGASSSSHLCITKEDGKSSVKSASCVATVAG
jgi:hypothetical protein